jgi:membrane-associated protein
MIDFILHIDEHLQQMLIQWGSATYVLLFLIVFCETGLVVTPFLPGDSLLFAAGSLAALFPETLHVGLLVGTLWLAAVLGDAVNYAIGAWVGPRAFSGRVPLLNQRHLLRAQDFYERHGGKAIVMARFVPIVRTFAPFVAGVAGMNYWRFAAYNVVGGLLWVAICTFAGYWFGNQPFVKKNFELVILAIIALSALPLIWEWYRERQRARSASLAE